MTSQEEPQPIQPNAQAAASPPTQTPSEQPPTEQAQAQPLPPTEAQAQPPQPLPVPPPSTPYPFAPVLKLPWIAPARKGAVIAIGIAAAVAMFGAGIGAGAAIFHNDQPTRPSYQFRVPDFGQRQVPGFPQQLPTPTPSPSRTS
jgi:hypothetical protein